MSGTKEKKLNLPQSLLLLLLIIVSVAVCIRLKTGGPMIGLFASWIFIYLFCKIFGISYANIVAGAYDAIRMVVPTLCLLMAIGVMIGTWLQSGTIATIISWGLKMINPSWLLPLLHFEYCNRYFLWFRRKRRCCHDGDRKRHGYPSWHGSRCCHLRCHVR
mgnify:CR=1 FL=1